DALPQPLLGAFETVKRIVASESISVTEKAFFRLGLLGILPRYSRAVASGGWLKWVRKRAGIKSFCTELRKRIGLRLRELEGAELPDKRDWSAHVADARCVPDESNSYS